jgi:dsRNA-specific ribonuclease
MNNLKNKLISKRDIIKILTTSNEELKDVVINNIECYQIAFVHKSYCYKNSGSDEKIEKLDGYAEQMKDLLPSYESWERMEFIGDSVIDTVVKEYFYDRFEVQDEGFLTKLKSKLVRSEKLAEFANFLEFKQFLLLSNKMENLTRKGENKGRNNQRFMEDSFEAFVGAIIKDNEQSGFYVAKKFIIGLLEKLVDFAQLIMTNDNFKDSLLRLFQSRRWGDPKYTELYEESSQTNRIFVVGVFVEYNLLNMSLIQDLKECKKTYKINEKGILFTKDMENKGFVLVSIGKGATKKEAQQNSGKRGLTNLKISWNY